MFISPTYRRIELKDGDSLINPIVNTNLCRYFSTSTYTHKTHDKDNVSYNSIILPSIAFEGCEISWVFDSQTQQKREYERLKDLLT